jgi:hypothetical protein
VERLIIFISGFNAKSRSTGLDVIRVCSAAKDG